MSEQFPRTAWRLTPGYQPKEITLLSEHKSFMFEGFQVEGSLMPISKTDVWPTKAEAIVAGHIRLDDQLAQLEKKRANIDKRRSTLAKAALPG